MPTGSWFYVDQGQQRGPVATEELAGWIQSARLPRNVQVWREGMPQWTAAETLSEITSQLQVVGFFVMGPNGPQGPVDLQVMLEWVRAGHIGRETLVWRTGLPDWITAGAVPEIAPYIPADGSRLRAPGGVAARGTSGPTGAICAQRAGADHTRSAPLRS